LKIYDISMLIHENMIVYKNHKDKRPNIDRAKKFETDGINESTIAMSLHAGTHIDANYHMIENGETIEKTDLNKLFSKCRVLDLTSVDDCITREDLEKYNIQKDEVILLKTKNSFATEFLFKFIYLKESGAKYLAEKLISVVGIDALGIERDQPGHMTHHALMSKGITIIEGLQLDEITEGEYYMCALPIKIKGGDGAPARVVLLDLAQTRADKGTGTCLTNQTPKLNQQEGSPHN